MVTNSIVHDFIAKWLWLTLPDKVCHGISHLVHPLLCILRFCGNNSKKFKIILCLLWLITLTKRWGVLRYANSVSNINLEFCKLSQWFAVQEWQNVEKPDSLCYQACRGIFLEIAVVTLETVCECTCIHILPSNGKVCFSWIVLYVQQTQLYLLVEWSFTPSAFQIFLISPANSVPLSTQFFMGRIFLKFLLKTHESFFSVFCSNSFRIYGSIKQSRQTKRYLTPLFFLAN